MQQISVFVYAVTYRLNDFVSRELSTQKGHFLISSSLKSYHIIAYVVLFVDRAVIGLNYNHVLWVRSDQCKVRCNQIAKFFKILMWHLVVIQTTWFLAYQPNQCCTPVWCVCTYFSNYVVGCTSSGRLFMVWWVFPNRPTLRVRTVAKRHMKSPMFTASFILVSCVKLP